MNILTHTRDGTSYRGNIFREHYKLLCMLSLNLKFRVQNLFVVYYNSMNFISF